MLTIDIFSDTVCPWCRIGKKNMFDALEQWKQEGNTDQEVTIRWRAYQLDPTTPPEGNDFEKVMIPKFGGREKAMQMFAHVQQAGAAAGVTLNFDKVGKMPNTILSHRIMALAPEHLHTPLMEGIMKAYFEDGRDIGDLDTLLDIAGTFGLDPEKLRGQLSAGAGIEQVQADLDQGRKLGIRGVPFFVLNNKFALSGAQPVQAFKQAFDQAAK